LARSDWLFQSLQMTRMASQAMGMKDHIIICGYGRCGQNMARLCEQAQVDYMALDLDPERVQKTAASGERVAFGDARRMHDLMAAGLLRAKAVAITYLDVQSSLKVLAHIQKIAPNTPVVVRTVDDANLEQLQQAGATEVVPEAIEGSLMLTSHVLALVGVPMRKVLRLVQAQREARYSLLKGYLHGDQDDAIDMGAHDVFKSMRVSEGAPCLGLTLQQLGLSSYPVRLISLRALDGQQLTLTDSAQLKTGDTLVLCGAAADLQSIQSQWFDQKGGLQ
jgi:monovalent cation:H+ antiporter-2, CPA2 family